MDVNEDCKCVLSMVSRDKSNNFPTPARFKVTDSKHRKKYNFLKSLRIQTKHTAILLILYVLSGGADW